VPPSNSHKLFVSYISLGNVLTGLTSVLSAAAMLFAAGSWSQRIDDSVHTLQTQTNVVLQRQDTTDRQLQLLSTNMALVAQRIGLVLTDAKGNDIVPPSKRLHQGN
jgi:hypothetical protein